MPTEKSPEGLPPAPDAKTYKAFEEIVSDVRSFSQMKPEGIKTAIPSLLRGISTLHTESKRNDPRTTEVNQKMHGVLVTVFEHLSNPLVLPDSELFSEQLERMVELFRQRKDGIHVTVGLAALHIKEATEAGLMVGETVATEKEVSGVRVALVRLLWDREVRTWTVDDFLKKDFSKSVSPRDRALGFLQSIIQKQRHAEEGGVPTKREDEGGRFGRKKRTMTVGEYIERLRTEGRDTYAFVQARLEADPQKSPEAFLHALHSARNAVEEAASEDGGADRFTCALGRLCPLLRGGEDQFCVFCNTQKSTYTLTDIIADTTGKDVVYITALRELHKKLTAPAALSYFQSYGRDPKGNTRVQFHPRGPDGKVQEDKEESAQLGGPDVSINIAGIIRNRLTVEDAMDLYEAWVLGGESIKATPEDTLHLYYELARIVSKYDAYAGKQLSEYAARWAAMKYQEAGLTGRVRLEGYHSIDVGPEVAALVNEDSKEIAEQIVREDITGEYKGLTAWEYFMLWLMYFKGPERLGAYWRICRDRRHLQILYEAGQAWDHLRGRTRDGVLAHRIREEIARGGRFDGPEFSSPKVQECIKALQRAAKMAGGPKAINDLMTTMLDNHEYRQKFIDGPWKTQWSDSSWARRWLYPRRASPGGLIPKRWRGAASHVSEAASVTRGHLSVLRARQREGKPRHPWYEGDARNASHIDPKALQTAMAGGHRFSFDRWWSDRVVWENLEEEWKDMQKKEEALEKQKDMPLLKKDAQKATIESEKARLKRFLGLVGLEVDSTGTLQQAQKPLSPEQLFRDHMQKVQQHMKALETWGQGLERQIAQHTGDIDPLSPLGKEKFAFDEECLKLPSEVEKVGGVLRGDWRNGFTLEIEGVRGPPPPSRQFPERMTNAQKALYERGLRDVDLFQTDLGKLRKVMLDLKITITNAATMDAQTLKKALETEIEVRLRAGRR